MASNPIINGKWMGKWWKQWQTLFSLAPKSLQIVTACHEVKMLAPWKKGYEQPRPHIEKQRHYVLTKVCLVKAMVFPVVMFGCESWTIKKAEHRRIDAFELWCWRRLLRVPWTSRRSNQSILKEISPEYSWEGLMLNWNSITLATWCEELTHWKRPWHWERLEAKREGNGRGWGRWMVSLTEWTLVWANSRRQWTGKPDVLQSLGTWLRLSRSSMVNPERNRHNSESKSRNTLKSCSRKMSVCWPIDM